MTTLSKGAWVSLCLWDLCTTYPIVETQSIRGSWWPRWRWGRNFKIVGSGWRHGLQRWTLTQPYLTLRWNQLHLSVCTPIPNTQLETSMSQQPPVQLLILRRDGREPKSTERIWELPLKWRGPGKQTLLQIPRSGLEKWKEWTGNLKDWAFPLEKPH